MSIAALAGFQPRLLQVRLDTTTVAAGARLNVTYWWQNVGDAAAESEERVFVHVRRAGEAEDAPGAVRYGADHDPSVPTFRWRPGRLLCYSSAVQFPPDAPPGDYVLLLGMYDVGTGRRRTLELPPAPGENTCRYVLTTVHVPARGGNASPVPWEQTFFPVPPQESGSLAPSPGQTLELGNGVLGLVLDATRPMPVAWRLHGRDLAGDVEGDGPDVRVLAVADQRVRPADVSPYHLEWRVRREDSRVVYHGQVEAGGQPSVSFDVVFALAGQDAYVSLERVTESADFQLVAVRLGRLVAARAGARLAIPQGAGRLVDPTRSAPAERSYAMDWANQVLAGVVHGDALVCALAVPGIDDRLVASVGDRWAGLGVSFEVRAPAVPPVPALRLSEHGAVRLAFAAPEGRAPDWTDGARLLRAGLSVTPPALYRQTVIYKVFCDSPGGTRYTTFSQAVDLIGRLHHLTDGAPQVVYLVGWQHRGHDTGYPDVFAVNPRLGGEEALRLAIQQAAELNAILSFHDNYDDAYEHSPAWDPEQIARDRAGALQKGGVWAGGQSYILSFSTYGPGPAQARVERTLTAFPIRGSYHIDVLSAVPRRWDFNPHHPAAGAASLAGKCAIVSAFNRHGVDVTSEGFCAPFVGVIGHAWHLIRQGQEGFAGEARIPFVPFIYHGHATWGGGKPNPADIMDALLYGATFSADFSRDTPLPTILDSYYLLAAPWFLLREREMTAYHAAGSRRRVEYGPDSYVEVDSEALHYEVVVDGRLVARDFTTVVPTWRGDAWLAYSRDGGALDYPAPPGWSAATRLEAVALTPTGPGPAVPARVVQGRLLLEVPKATPCRVAAGNPTGP